MSAGINLFVAQLHKGIDDNALKMEFGRFGEIISSVISKDELGYSKGFGFVQFSSMADGLKAIEEMNGKTWHGKRLAVEVGNTQEDDGGKCYNRPQTMTWASQLDLKPTSLVNWDDSEVSETAEHDQNNDSVKQRMRKLFDSQLYTDVIFYPKGNDSTSISAHRAVLAIGSPLFAKMLFGDGNTYVAGPKMEVRISNLSFEAFSSIIRFLYTDELSCESDSQVQEILEGANQFEIQSLVDQCSSYFENQVLTPENVCSKLQMSTTNKIKALKNRCTQYIQDNTYKVINSVDFQRCTSATIRTICKLETLNLKKESYLLNAAITWLNAQSTVIRKQTSEPLLRCIRFLTFSVNELSEVLKSYPDLIDPADGLQILLYLTNPPRAPAANSLPAWCNKNTSNRCVFDPSRFEARQQRNPDHGAQSRLIIPLKPSLGVQNVSELVSLLQMKCTGGRHEILGIKLAFQHPVTDRSSIRSLSIFVHVHPSEFNYCENIEIANSLEVRIPFTRRILARQGDWVDFKVEARNIELYTFLEFDDKRTIPPNLHFQCSVRSDPPRGKFFMISEIEYGPQKMREKRR